MKKRAIIGLGAGCFEIIFVLLIITSLIFSSQLNEVEAVDPILIDGQIQTSNGDNFPTRIQFEETSTGAHSGIITAPTGAFSTSLLPGNYRFQIDDNNVLSSNLIWDFAFLKTVSLSVDTTLDVTVPTAILSGTVTDSLGNPIQGVQIATNRLPMSFDSFSGNFNGKSPLTDANGFYSMAVFPSSIPEIRVFPPSSVSPTFEIAGLDVFSDTTLDISINVITVTPIEALQFLINHIDGLSIPNGVQKSLISPLDQAAEMLTDNNSRNDSKVCSKLDLFIKKVESQRGKNLEDDEADFLVKNAEILKNDLGCV